MDTARHIKTGKIYSAIELQKMSINQRNTFKGMLECEECKQPASFRKESKDGKKPCFSSRHLENCTMKNSNPQDSNPDNENDREIVNIKEANLDELGVKFTNYFKANQDDSDNDLIEDFDKKGTSHKVYEDNPSESVTKNLTLPKILHYAINNKLAEQDYNITVDDRSVYISRLCHKWNKLKPEHEEMVRFYWGYIKSIGNSIWLNSGDSYPFNGFSIKLDNAVSEMLCQSLSKFDGKLKYKVPAIVYGKLKFSTSGKPFVEVTDITTLYINRRAFKKNLEAKVQG